MITESNWCINRNRDGTAGVRSKEWVAGSISIPPVVEGVPVTQIGTYNFSNYPDLISVIIPEGVVTIEKDAFSFCPKLTTVILPKSLKLIKHHAFNDCPALKYVIVPSCYTEIEYQAFDEHVVICKASNEPQPNSFNGILPSNLIY